MDRTSRSISLPNQHANHQINKQTVNHLNPPSRSASLKKVTFDKGLNHSLSQSFDRPIEQSNNRSNNQSDNQSNNQRMPHSFVEVEDENPADAPEYGSSDDTFYHSNNQPNKDSLMQTAFYHRHDDDDINQSLNDYEQSNDGTNFHPVTQALNLFKESEPDYESKYIDDGQALNQSSHKSQSIPSDHPQSNNQTNKRSNDRANNGPNNQSTNHSDDEARRRRMEKYQNYAAVAEPLYNQSNNQTIDESIKPIIESNNQFLNDYDHSLNQSILQSDDVAIVDPNKFSSIVAQALPHSNSRSFNQSNHREHQQNNHSRYDQDNPPDDRSVSQSISRSAGQPANLFAPSINVFDGEIGVGSGYGKGRGRVSISKTNSQTSNQLNKSNNQSGAQTIKPSADQSNYQSINQTSTQEQHKPGRKLFARHNQTTQQSINQPNILTKSATSTRPSANQQPNNQLNNQPIDQPVNQTSPASILHAQIAHLQSEVQKYESARAELESEWNERSRELKFMAQEQKAREIRFENERKEFLIFQEKESKKLKNERIKLDNMKRELTGLPPRADRIAIEKLQSINQSINQEFKVKEEQYKSQINLLRQQLKQSINQTKELREQQKMVEKERVHEWQKQSTKSIKQSNNQPKPTIAFGSRSIKQSNTINHSNNQTIDDAAKERKTRISEALKATIMDWSLDQSNNPSNKQSHNQSNIHQSSSPLAHSSNHQTNDDPINPSNNHSTNQSNNRSNNQFNFDPSLIVQSVNQNGKTEHRLIDGSRVIDFPNGTRKLIDCSMNSRTEFANGDWKEDRNIESNNQSNNQSDEESDGVQTIYYYAVRGILETRLIDGTIRYQFNNGQMETHFIDGSKEIVFEDGNRVLVNEAGEVID